MGQGKLTRAGRCWWKPVDGFIQLGVLSHMPQAETSLFESFLDGDPNYAGWMSVPLLRDWIIETTTKLTILPVPSESLVVQELSVLHAGSELHQAPSRR